ncbi:protein of unknown function [Nitrospina watsonii]|uniref:Uncharacterized protein n=1 Tax=Nitrospina watsonii TaxID=1323948 RepID=A0ABM9HEM5_9BACT|nr:protein of unknown function [Nitrospina watsonii]
MEPPMDTAGWAGSKYYPSLTLRITSQFLDCHSEEPGHARREKGTETRPRGIVCRGPRPLSF